MVAGGGIPLTSSIPNWIQSYLLTYGDWRYCYLPVPASRVQESTEPDKMLTWMPSPGHPVTPIAGNQWFLESLRPRIPGSLYSGLPGMHWVGYSCMILLEPSLVGAPALCPPLTRRSAVVVFPHVPARDPRMGER